MDSSKLDKLIDSLERMVDDALPCHTKWKPVWDLIRNIGASFKETYYPTLSDKQEARDRFQSLVQSVKQTQAEERQYHECMAGESEQYKHKILACASAATPPSGFVEGIAAIVLLPQQFIKAAIPSVSIIVGHFPIHSLV